MVEPMQSRMALEALVETKSVNHRFCEVNIKSGGKTGSVDERIKKTGYRTILQRLLRDSGDLDR